MSYSQNLGWWRVVFGTFFFWNCAGAWKTMISSKNDNICLYTKTCKNDNTLFKKWWLGAIYQILMVAHVTLSYSFLVVGFSYHVSFSFHPHLSSTAMPSRPLHAGRSHGPRCLGSWLYKKFPGWSQQRWQQWYLSDEISSDWVEGWEVGGGSTEFGTFGSASSGVVRTSSNQKRYHFCLGLRMFGRS